MLFESLTSYILGFEKNFQSIPQERKLILERLSDYIATCNGKGDKAKLTFICTHNSRRSHLSQIWAQALTAYYHLDFVECYSGGTEVTCFNVRAVRAMRELGFQIPELPDTGNPHYKVYFSDAHPPVQAFSKVYDDPFNPQQQFAAIMVCTSADGNCPYVAGASKRISLPFLDPKEFDDTPQEMEMYKTRSLQIANELAYAFSKAAQGK